MDVGLYVPKMKKTILTVENCKTSLCVGMLVYVSTASAYLREGTIDAEAYVGILERHTLPSKRLFPGTPCLFQQDNARPHSAQVITVWLRRHRVRVFDWPAVQIYLLLTVWSIMKRRIRQRKPQIVEQLKSCIHQGWPNMPMLYLTKTFNFGLIWPEHLVPVIM